MVSSVFFCPIIKRSLKRLNLEKNKLVKIIQVFITFNLVSFSWIFFRAKNLADAAYITTNMFRGIGSNLRLLIRSLTPQFNPESFQRFLNPYLMGQDGKNALILVAVLLVALVMAIFHAKPKLMDFPLNQSTLVRWGIYYLAIFAILFLGVFSSYQFIYNQF
jgi:alginate O-acetyltransferase complex protein AlgI